MNASRRRATGFSLVEVLVSIVVLSIGLLGAAQMLLVAVRGSSEAAAFGSAVGLARELAEKTRLNAGATAGAYVADSRSPVAGGGGCTGSGAPCSAAQLAQWDLREWQARVSGALPDARFVVCFDDQPWNAGAGEYRWACGSAGASLVVKLGWTPRIGLKVQRAGAPPMLVMQLPAGAAGDV